MILSDRDIKKAIAEGKILIEPAPDFSVQLGSCSIDLHLGDTFRVFQRFKKSSLPIDLKSPVDLEEVMEVITIPEGDAFVMQPGDFALANTVEHLEITDDLLGRIEGRSSLGRLGIIVHGTASVFDPGWRGKPVMELGNLGTMPVALYPGMRICAFTFEELSSPTEQPYYKKKGNKYGGQKDPAASKFAKELGNEG